MAIACGIGFSSFTSSGRPAEEFGRVEISLHLERQNVEGSNQFAVWIQNQRGEVVKTLFATRFAAEGGFFNELDCLPLWVDRANARFIPGDEVDGFSGATPPTGNYTYIWDGTDRKGNQVPFGNYVFYVEGNLHWENWIVFSGLIPTGRREVTIRAQSEFDSDDHDIFGSGLISDVVARYIPAEDR